MSCKLHIGWEVLLQVPVRHYDHVPDAVCKYNTY